MVIGLSKASSRSDDHVGAYNVFFSNPKTVKLFFRLGVSFVYCVTRTAHTHTILHCITKITFKISKTFTARFKGLDRSEITRFLLCVTLKKTTTYVNSV